MKVMGGKYANAIDDIVLFVAVLTIVHNLCLQFRSLPEFPFHNYIVHESLKCFITFGWIWVGW